MDSAPWTSFSVTTCPFRGRFQSFSSFFPMKRSVHCLHGKSSMGRRLRLSALPCRRRSLPHRRLVPVSGAVASAAHDTGLTVGTVMERSHMPLQHHGFGRLIWSRQPDARHLGGSTQTQQDSLACRGMRRPSAFSTSSALAWCLPNQVPVSAASSDEHVEIDETWVGGRTRGEGRRVSTTRFSSLNMCRRGSSSETGNARRTSERTDAMPGVSALAVVPDRLSLTRFVGSMDRAPLL